LFLVSSLFLGTLYLESNYQWASQWHGGISAEHLTHIWFTFRPSLQCTCSGLEIFAIQLPHTFLTNISTASSWILQWGANVLTEFL